MSVEIARDMINNAQKVPLGGLRQLKMIWHGLGV
jgi:hypothetical protein